MNQGIEALGSSKQERKLLARVGLVITGLVIGVGAGYSAKAWADREVEKMAVLVQHVDDRVDVLDRRLTLSEKALTMHLDDMLRERPKMDEEVRALRGKLDMLIEDCFRRGGCRR